MMAPDDNTFDSRLREAMQQLPEQALPILQQPDWAQFSAQLDEAMPVGQPSNATFDDAIATKLAQTQAPTFNMVAWNKLAQHLDQEMPSAEDTPQPNATSDDIVRQKLKDIKPEYRSEHWLRMEQELKSRSPFFFWLQKATLVKTAVAALFVGTIFNIWLTEPWLNRNPESIIAIEDTAAGSQFDGVAQKTTKQPNSANPSVSAYKNDTYTSTTRQSDASASSLHVLPQQAIDSKTQSAVSSNNDSNVLSEVIQTNKPENTWPNKALDVENKALDVENKQTDMAESSLIASSNTNLLPILSTRHLQNVSMEPGALSHFAMPVLPKFPKSTWRVGISASPNLDFVTSPSIVRTSSKSPSYIGGFSVGAIAEKKIINGWSIETGLFYENKNYRSPFKENIGNIDQGFYQVQLKNVVFRMARIPLTVRKYFKSSKRTTFYAQGTVNANVVLQSSDNRLYNSIGFVQPTDSLGQPDVVEALEIPRIFTDGVLNGGSYKRNVYMTMGLGLGADYRINAQISAFIEPQFQHYVKLNTMGGDKDRFNTVSVNAGLRRKL